MVSIHSPSSVMSGTLDPQADPLLDVFEGLLTCMNPGGRKSENIRKGIWATIKLCILLSQIKTLCSDWHLVCHLQLLLSICTSLKFCCLTLSQTSPGFYVSAVEVFGKQSGKKEKLFVMNNFSFSHGVFYPPEELSAIFIKFKIVVCKFFKSGRVQNLSFGKGLTLCHTILT